MRLIQRMLVMLGILLLNTYCLANAATATGSSKAVTSPSKLFQVLLFKIYWAAM